MGPIDLQLKITSLQFLGFTWLFVIPMRRMRHRLSRAKRLTFGSFVIKTAPIMDLRLCLHVLRISHAGHADAWVPRTCRVLVRKNSRKIKLLIDICLPIEILELIYLFEYLLSRLNFVLINILSKNYVKILKIELPNKNSFYWNSCLKKINFNFMMKKSHENILITIFFFYFFFASSTFFYKSVIYDIFL